MKEEIWPGEEQIQFKSNLFNPFQKTIITQKIIVCNKQFNDNDSVNLHLNNNNKWLIMLVLLLISKIKLPFSMVQILDVFA